jgi:hypothetical protein
MNKFESITEDKIKILRKKLNNLLNTEPLSSIKVLELSKSLDELILAYYRPHVGN